MRRVTVRCLGSDPSTPPKGVVVDGAKTATLVDLKRQLASALHRDVRDEDSILVPRGEDLVEVADVDYIREDDQILVGNLGNVGHRQTDDEAQRPRWLRLNVGGQVFMTSRSTVELQAPESMLARMFSKETAGLMESGARDESGAILIDRSPKYFSPILDYLRNGKLILDKDTNPEGVLEEARYFGIDALYPKLEQLCSAFSSTRDEAALTRRDVVDAILTTAAEPGSGKELRFQGVNLTGADLSKLDLRCINFKYANLSQANLTGANLSFCNLERADLSRSTLDGAQLFGVKMLCANLEKASLRGCNFDDPAGSQANMEGVNLREALLEGSSMARANLRVATIKHGNLKSCDLRGAILAGADLENCNLTSSDLGEANLRGANLKDTTLELMMSPLHMSQTIR